MIYMTPNKCVAIEMGKKRFENNVILIINIFYSLIYYHIITHIFTWIYTNTVTHNLSNGKVMMWFGHEIYAIVFGFCRLQFLYSRDIRNFCFKKASLSVDFNSVFVF